ASARRAIPWPRAAVGQGDLPCHQRDPRRRHDRAPGRAERAHGTRRRRPGVRLRDRTRDPRRSEHGAPSAGGGATGISGALGPVRREGEELLKGQLSRTQHRFLPRAVQVFPLLVALLVTACGSATTPRAASSAPATAKAVITGVTDTEVVVGSWGPQDGPAGAYGAIDRTLDAYFKMINDQGGINGRKIRFIYENDSYQPAKTVAAVKKLVEEDKVFALCGGLGTAHNAAVMDYLVSNNVPHVWPATGTTAHAVPLKKNIYAVQLNYTTEATLATQYALDTMSAKQIAVFYQNDAFGKEGLDAVQAELKKRNLPAATGVSYETADTNFSAQALKLQTTGADTVILYAVPKPGGSIIAEMGKIGYAPK